MDRRALLQAIALRLQGASEGHTPTAVPYLSLVRRSRPTPIQPGALSPSFCLIVQGGKRLKLADQVLDYGPGDFLTALIDVAVAGNVRIATSRKPYLGLRIDLTTEDLAAVAADAHLDAGEPRGPTTFVGRADATLLELHLRLLRLLDRPDEAPYLASLLKQELVFRLLTGPYGGLFRQRALFDPRVTDVGAAIAWIRHHYREPLSVAKLARSSGLSVSGLHHKFKSVTSMSPLQYQKVLRLQAARQLMLSGRANATGAALQVGYESPSQFSREYRRQFGRPPRADAIALQHGGAGAGAD